MTRAQGKHREFSLNQSVATLIMSTTTNRMDFILKKKYRLLNVHELFLQSSVETGWNRLSLLPTNLIFILTE